MRLPTSAVPTIEPSTTTPQQHCGHGNVNSGVCADSSQCCFKAGWCANDFDQCREGGRAAASAAHAGAVRQTAPTRLWHILHMHAATAMSTAATACGRKSAAASGAGAAAPGTEGLLRSPAVCWRALLGQAVEPHRPKDVQDRSPAAAACDTGRTTAAAAAARAAVARTAAPLPSAWAGRAGPHRHRHRHRHPPGPRPRPRTRKSPSPGPRPRAGARCWAGRRQLRCTASYRRLLLKPAAGMAAGTGE